jgi:hypothetical protein
MLEHHNINSGDDYADLLIKTILEESPSSVVEEEMLKYWVIKVREMCVEKYNKYIIGQEETFMLSDVEMDESYRLSIEEMVNDSLKELSEKGLLEISIDDNGEILYGLSEEGKAYTKDITDDNDNDN